MHLVQLGQTTLHVTHVKIDSTPGSQALRHRQVLSIVDEVVLYPVERLYQDRMVVGQCWVKHWRSL